MAGGTYYCEGLLNEKQESLKTRNRAEAFRLVAARNEAAKANGFSRQLAQVYWNAAHPVAATRTWQQVMEEIPKLKTGSTRVRWLCAIQDKALDPLRKLVVLETRSEHFLKSRLRMNSTPLRQSDGQRHHATVCRKRGRAMLPCLLSARFSDCSPMV